MSVNFTLASTKEARVINKPLLNVSLQKGLTDHLQIQFSNNKHHVRNIKHFHFVPFTYKVKNQFFWSDSGDIDQLGLILMCALSSRVYLVFLISMS